MACFVLVHGAFHGGWVWSRVAARLRAAGHDVLTPTLTGCGDRFHLLTRDVGLATHVDDLVATLAHEDVRGGVLVGHERPERDGMVSWLRSRSFAISCRRLRQAAPG